LFWNSKNVETLHLFVFYEVDPHLFCVVINETHVIFAPSNGFCLRGPHT
jgi:hypothetical protein